MIVTPLKTRKVLPSAYTLFELLDEYVTEFAEGNVLAITSKIVSLCEGAVVSMDNIERDALIRHEAEQYAVIPGSDYGVIFTVVRNTLIPNAGVDESNAAGMYVIWPRNPQATANAVRAYLCKRFGIKEVGVIITDSTGQPMRWGMGGIAIAHSGFKELHNYVGRPDLFGRNFAHETAAVSGGLAAAAVLVMGEGAESTPLAVIGDVPFVEFQGRDPLPEELEAARISLDNDIFSPMLKSVPWRQGGRKRN